MAFLESADPETLFISALTVGELHRGAAAKRRTDPEAGARLATWIEGMERSFSDRIVSIDAAVASVWGSMSVDRTRPVIDTLIAATAAVHDLTLVTRNVHDVRGLAVRTLDPWR